MAKEDEADNYAMEFTEPLEYGSYAGQWLSYDIVLSGKGRNHKEPWYDAQDALDYIEKASKGHIKFDDDGHGNFSSFTFDGTTFLQENKIMYSGSATNTYPETPSSSEKWNDFVVDERLKKNGINESFIPNDHYHIAYVAAQMAFAVKYNVFNNVHSHLMNAWDFWHNGEAVTAETQQHHDTLSKWTVLYFDNPLNGGRKIVDIYPYMQDELLERAYKFDSLIKSAPASGDAYVKWCKNNVNYLNNEPAIAFWYICYCMGNYNNL